MFLGSTTWITTRTTWITTTTTPMTTTTTTTIFLGCDSIEINLVFYYNCFNWILLWLPLTMKLCVCFFTAIKRIEKDKDTDYAPCYKNILGSMLTNFAFYCFLSNCPNFFLLWNLYWSWNFLVASKGDLFKNCLLF